MNNLSISLNNHESRIKALESKTGKFKTEVVWTGSSSTATLSIPKLANYSVCVCYTSGRANGGFTLTSDGQTGGWYDDSYDAVFDGVWCSWTGTSLKVNCKNGRTTNRLKAVVAIGILYTYRYIIKSAQKFTPLSYLFNKEV